MSESGVLKSKVVSSRTAIERTKSLRDIDEQYSRIDNRLYRQYLDYEIDEDTFNNRRRTIQNAYDRYQTNIVRQTQPGWQRGLNYPLDRRLLDRRYTRNVYAKPNNR